MGSWSQLYSGGDNPGGSSLAVAPNADGRLEAFAVVDYETVLHTWQTAPNGSWVGSWSALASNDTELRADRGISVAASADGRLEVFAVYYTDTTDQWLLAHTWQIQPNGAWAGSWQKLPLPPFEQRDNNGIAANPFCQFAAGRTGDGRLEVVVSDAGNFGQPPYRTWHIWQTAPNGSWVDSWSELYPGFSSDVVAGGIEMAHNAAGHLEVFGTDSTDLRSAGRAWHTQLG